MQLLNKKSISFIAAPSLKECFVEGVGERWLVLYREIRLSVGDSDGRGVARKSDRNIWCPPGTLNDAQHASRDVLSSKNPPYHRRARVCCCILAGEIDSGGLATRMPVLGLTIGMAFLVRTADGW